MITKQKISIVCAASHGASLICPVKAWTACITRSSQVYVTRNQPLQAPHRESYESLLSLSSSALFACVLPRAWIA